jgi:hypothetical protein
MRAIFDIFRRKNKSVQDIGLLENVVYNESAGAKKIIIIEPVVRSAVGASDSYAFGSYVKVTGTTYTLDCLGKAHSSSVVYRRGDLVTVTTTIYVANQDNVTGTFDASKWAAVSTKQIGPVTITAGSVVCVGKWHNTVSVAGFLVEDESVISKVE